MILGLPLWFVFALSASLTWAVSYVIDERLLKMGFSPGFLLMAHSLFIFPVYIFFAMKAGNPMEDIQRVFSSKTLMFFMVASAVCWAAGNFFLLYGIADKNATLVSMIEISYPFFIALFAWIFFKDVQVNWWTALGGVFVFIGVCIIYLKGGDI